MEYWKIFRQLIRRRAYQSNNGPERAWDIVLANFRKTIQTRGIDYFVIKFLKFTFEMLQFLMTGQISRSIRELYFEKVKCMSHLGRIYRRVENDSCFYLLLRWQFRDLTWGFWEQCFRVLSYLFWFYITKDIGSFKTNFIRH